MHEVNRHIAQLQENVLSALKKKPTREGIHDLRVAIKRLRALWEIHPIGTEIPFKTSFPFLKKLFRAGATYRDLQIIQKCLALIEDPQDKEAPDTLLKQQIGAHKKDLQKKLRGKKFAAGVQDDLRKFTSYYKVAGSVQMKQQKRKYAENLIDQLKSIPSGDDETLHTLRKMVKNTLYQQEAFASGTHNGKHTGKQKLLHTLQEQLGTWHDWLNCLQWLQANEGLLPAGSLVSLKKHCANRVTAHKREALRTITLFLKNIAAGEKSGRFVN